MMAKIQELSERLANQIAAGRSSGTTSFGSERTSGKCN